MPAYIVTNTAGTTVATINVASTTGSAFPIELIGQGISLYGPTIAKNQYRQLENFALATPPSNPVTGQFWYKRNTKIPHFYNGTQFIPLLAASSSYAGQFTMLPAAANLDLTIAGNTAIFQAPGTLQRFHPTGIMMLPVGPVTATSPAIFNLTVGASEDVLENVPVSNMTTVSHAFYRIEGTTRFLSGSESLFIAVTTPASGGALTVNISVFGFVSE
jgi:hypothetical protein